MSSWLGDLDAVTVFTEDLPATRAFYAEVFGLALLAEDEDSAAYRFGRTVLNLLRAEAAGELVAPGAVAGPGHGARLQFTVSVADADAVCVELARRGVTLLNGPVDRPWGVRTAAFTDPAGTVWEVAADLLSSGG